MTDTEFTKETPSIVIRRSVSLLILRIIFIELIFEIIYLTWRGLLHFLPLSLENIITLNAVSILFFLILITIIQNIFLVIIALRWVNNFYEIRQDEIAHITGILSKTERAYPYRDIQAVTIHQDILGRLLNYGSVHLYIPTLGYDLNFNEVSDPAKFVELVKSVNPNVEGGKFIFRR